MGKKKRGERRSRGGCHGQHLECTYRIKQTRWESDQTEGIRKRKGMGTGRRRVSRVHPTACIPPGLNHQVKCTITVALRRLRRPAVRPWEKAVRREAAEELCTDTRKPISGEVSAAPLRLGW